LPQSLTKTHADAGQALALNGRALIAAHEQIVGVLRQRLGANHGELLATPKVQPDGGVTWTTPSMAEPVLLSAQLPEEAREKLQARAERMLDEIRGLAEQLRGEGPAAQMVAQMLDGAVQHPPGEWLYSVGGKPVWVMWGHAVTGSAAALPAEAAAVVSSPLSVPMAAPMSAPGSAAAALPASGTPAVAATSTAGAPSAGLAADTAASSAGRSWLPWAGLGFLALIVLLWGLKSCSDATATDPALAEQLAQADALNKSLEDEIARQRVAAPAQQCVPDAPPPAASAPEPAPPASAPFSALAPPPASAPATAPNPLEELKRRIASAGEDCNRLSAMLKSEPLLKASGKDAAALKQQMMGTMAQHCRENAIRAARNLCPGQRPKELAPDMAIVFDASGSMAYSLGVTEAEVRAAGPAEAAEQMMRLFGLGGGGGAQERLTREPRRITVAKEATADVVARLPSDMNTGLVLVDQCPAARSVGSFSPTERAALLAQLRGIEPRRGTPLADGIARAGELVDGVNRESTILVVSDGTESCGGDPCAVAAALKLAKPYLKINVVDITGTGAGNCVAQATGGKVYTAKDADELIAQTQRAAQDAMGPANCKR